MKTIEEIELKEKKEITLDVKDLDDRTWKSGCLQMDKGAVMFFSTLGISLIIIAFCIYQLVSSTSCETQTTYMGLLTLILGIWVKSPAFK
jgi:hypothetical protein